MPTAVLVMALVEFVKLVDEFDLIHFQIIILGSFISDTYFTSIKTIVSISIVTVAVTIIVSDFTLLAKHSAILLEFAYKAHVVDLVFSTLRTL